MQSKSFNLKLEITADHVRIVTPGGAVFPYSHEHVPDALYSIINRALLEDADLNRSIASRLKPSKNSEDQPSAF